MIHMAVRHDDVGHRLALKRAFQRFEVLIDHRAWVNYGHFTAPDELNACSSIGECSGIVCNHSADQRTHLRHFTVFEFDLFDERNGHG